MLKESHDSDEEVHKREELIKLLTVIIQCSTATPFKWHANKFMCFYCSCPFEHSTTLIQHTKEEHEDAKLRTILRSTATKSRSIKLDVRDLYCKKCDIPIQNLQELVNHLTEKHGLDMDKEITHCIYPYVLSEGDMSCLECTMPFRFFGPLLIHTHKYHSKTKQFLCEHCGQGFIARANVDSHIRNAHPDLCTFQCKECEEIFPSSYKLNHHVEKSHGPARMKCPKCPEILTSSYLKKRHLAFVHDVKSAQFQCDMCPKIFTLKNSLLAHKQRVHLKEKNFACEICGFKVFSKDLLRRHMVKHDDSRPFECDLCQKTFQRKKTLEYHRRIHTNDKRNQCKECGRAFVQWTSLKLHMRVHHSGTNETWTEDDQNMRN
ncbi:hypothetical protein MSG28_014726 [Choristoneura fumiferana]|uniref:Uncharacterized protein n=1 Tax=Choristoneura fumiferana TaxID=7141 RepID=A0ACC0JSH2_CHOFU|nr:hypothetical protein MSG28_014726 [Choristoneura fumiferana]